MIDRGKRRKNGKHYKTCVLCDKLILDEGELREEKVSLEVVLEITGKEYAKAKAGLTSYKFLHDSCLKKLDIPTQRRLLVKNYSHRLLNIDHGVWVSLDEYGKPKYDTLYSEEKNIDEKIQRLKKKGIRNLNSEEKIWLKELIA